MARVAATSRRLLPKNFLDVTDLVSNRPANFIRRPAILRSRIPGRAAGFLFDHALRLTRASGDLVFGARLHTSDSGFECDEAVNTSGAEETRVARAAHRHEPVPKIKRRGAFMPRHDLQLQAAPAELLSARHGRIQQSGANTAAAQFRPDIKLLEPANGSAVFRAQVRSSITNADSLAVFLREQDEAMPRLGEDAVDNVPQQRDRRVDVVLDFIPPIRGSAEMRLCAPQVLNRRV